MRERTRRRLPSRIPRLGSHKGSSPQKDRPGARNSPARHACSGSSPRRWWHSNHPVFVLAVVATVWLVMNLPGRRPDHVRHELDLRYAGGEMSADKYRERRKHLGV